MLCRRKEGRDFRIRGSGKKGLTCDFWASGAGKKGLTSGRRVRGRRGHDAREKARKFLVKEGKGNPPQKPTPSAASLKSQHEKGPSLLPCSCRTRALDVLSHGGKRPWDIGNRSDVCGDQAVTSQAAQRLPVTGQVAHSASMIAQHASARETTLES